MFSLFYNNTSCKNQGLIDCVLAWFPDTPFELNVCWCTARSPWATWRHIEDLSLCGSSCSGMLGLWRTKPLQDFWSNLAIIWPRYDLPKYLTLEVTCPWLTDSLSSFPQLDPWWHFSWNKQTLGARLTDSQSDFPLIGLLSHDQVPQLFTHYWNSLDVKCLLANTIVHLKW